MRYALKVTLQVILLSCATAAGIAIGYFWLRTPLTKLMLHLSHVPSTDFEQFNIFYDSAPVMLMSLLSGSAVSVVLIYMTDKLWQQAVAAGFLAGDDADAPVSRVNMHLWFSTSDEEGNQTEQMFEMDVEADKLSDFFHRRGAPALLCKKKDGTSVKLSRSAPLADSEEDAGFQPIFVSLREGGKALFCLETTDVGRYWQVEDKDIAYCRYKLTFRGLEEETKNQLLFKGAPRDLKDIFLS